MEKQEALQRCGVLKKGMMRFMKRLDKLQSRIEAGPESVAPGDACELATAAAIEAEAARQLACGE